MMSDKKGHSLVTSCRFGVVWIHWDWLLIGVYSVQLFEQHGDHKHEITEPIMDRSAWTKARVKVMSTAKFENVAISSFDIKSRLEKRTKQTISMNCSMI